MEKRRQGEGTICPRWCDIRVLDVLGPPMDMPVQAGNAERSRTNSGTNANGDRSEGNTPQRGPH